MEAFLPQPGLILTCHCSWMLAHFSQLTLYTGRCLNLLVFKRIYVNQQKSHPIGKQGKKKKGMVSHLTYPPGLLGGRTGPWCCCAGEMFGVEMMKGHKFNRTSLQHKPPSRCFRLPCSLVSPCALPGSGRCPPPVPISPPVPRAPHSVLPKAGCSSGRIHQLCGVPLPVELGAAAAQKKVLLVLLCEPEAAPVLEALIKPS